MPAPVVPLALGATEEFRASFSSVSPRGVLPAPSVMRGAHTAISYATKVSVGLVDLPSIMIDRLSRPEAVVTYP